MLLNTYAKRHLVRADGVTMVDAAAIFDAVLGDWSDFGAA